MIVVIDASTFISATLKADSLPEQALLRALRRPNRLVISAAVADEYREVIARPKFDRFVSAERRQRVLDIVLFAAERIEPTETVRECRDPKDDKYLELAAAAGADVIVSTMFAISACCTPGEASRSCPRRISSPALTS